MSHFDDLRYFAKRFSDEWTKEFDKKFDKEDELQPPVKPMSYYDELRTYLSTPNEENKMASEKIDFILAEKIYRADYRPDDPSKYSRFNLSDVLLYRSISENLENEIESMVKPGVSLVKVQFAITILEHIPPEPKEENF